jgi:uncharacterized membrane protein
MKPEDLVPAAHKRRLLFTPGVLFLLVGILVGGAFCIFIPFGAGFDEETHLARIWEISSLHLLPNDSGRQNAAFFPGTFLQLSYQRRYFLSPAQDLLESPLINETIDHQSILLYSTRAIYPPTTYFPQAFVAGIGWRLFDLPIVPVSIVMRLAGFLVYLIGAYFAIRFLPSGKWVMVALALSPMALFQAATLNADGYTIAASFLFIAYTIKVAAGGPAPIGRLQVIGLIAFILAVGLAKQGSFVVLPLLLILPYRRFSKKSWFFLIWGAAIAAVALAFIWSALVINRSAFAGSDSSQDLISHLRLALANPLEFLSLYFQGFYSSFDRYFHEWVGVYGHWLGTVPPAIYWMYPAGVLAAVFSETRSTLDTWKNRLPVIGVFAISAAALIMFFFLLYYQPGVSDVGGVQGRYFLALTPLLIIPLAGWIRLPGWVSKSMRGLSLLLVFGALGFYSFGLYATYYSDCASSLYTHQSCYQPIYKNIDKTNAPSIEINQTTQVSQSFVDTCGQLEGTLVWIKSIPPGARGSLRFEILDTAGKSLASHDTPLAEISTPSYFQYLVEKPIGQEGKTYQLRISSPDSLTGQGALLAISDHVYYTQGKLSKNDQPVGADLIFKYGCAEPDKQISTQQ